MHVLHCSFFFPESEQEAQGTCLSRSEVAEFAFEMNNAGYLSSCPGRLGK